MKKYSPQTRHIHADRLINKPEQGGVHQSTSNSVLFDFDQVEALESVFQGKTAGHVYSRSSSPSIVGLQNILCDMESGVASTCFATGMAAISAVIFSLLKQGDHVVVSHFLFGNTRSFMDSLADFGITVSYVDTTDAKQVEAAITDKTRLLFCESVANPGTQVSDLNAIGSICAKQRILFVLDNTMTPCVMFDSKAVNANLIITSLTKYISGHGNVLGGVVTDLGTFDWQSFPNIKPQYQVPDTSLWGMTQIRKKGLRDIGATLAPASAHSISVGIETLSMRMKMASENAMKLAAFMSSDKRFTLVNYPGLPLHPQHDLATSLFANQYGAILSFCLDESIDFRRYLNNLHLVLRATHLGDTRTLALPVASTIFHENGPQRRAEMGIQDNLIRISVGIENVEDLIDDFIQAFENIE